MKKILFTIIATLFLTVNGCSLSQESRVSSNEPPASSVLSSSLNQQEQKMTDLSIFKGAFPEAEIVGQITADIDNDKEDDLILIYNNPNNTGKISRSNLWVATQSNIGALCLGGAESGFEFADGPDSLKILQEPKRISVLLNDPKTQKDTDFQITVTTDMKLKAINFAIKTVEKESASHSPSK